MRESRVFGQRTQPEQSKEPKKKYFLFTEGDVTEQIYFKAIKEKSRELGIHPLIELRIMERSESEKGWSHPKKIVNRIVDLMAEKKSKTISYQTMIDIVLDYIKDHIKQQNLWDQIKKKILEEFQTQVLEMDVENIDEECRRIQKIINTFNVDIATEEKNWDKIIREVSKVVNKGAFTYEKDFDKVCVIVDRDRESFTQKQYGEVLAICKEEGFDFHVTNPCFEFWLLLHVTDHVENREEILANKKKTNKRGAVEIELKKVYPYFQKTEYNPDFFVANIDKAVENARKFCEDIHELENRLGSSLGKLMVEIRNKG